MNSLTFLTFWCRPREGSQALMLHEALESILELEPGSTSSGLLSRIHDLSGCSRFVALLLCRNHGPQPCHTRCFCKKASSYLRTHPPRWVVLCNLPSLLSMSKLFLGNKLPAQLCQRSLSYITRFSCVPARQCFRKALSSGLYK